MKVKKTATEPSLLLYECTFKNITCENSQYGIYAVGLPNKDCVYNISVEDSQFNNVKKGGNRIENVTDITMKNLQINGKTVK